MNDSSLSYQGVEFHVVPMIDMVYLLFYIFDRFYDWGKVCGGVYICGKNRLTFVGVLRWWAGLRLTALQGAMKGPFLHLFHNLFYFPVTLVLC